MSSQSPFSLESSLPSGAWILYFHPAKETRWHIDTFKVVAKVKTFQELGQVFSAISANDWVRGKFFFCPEGTPPLMENARNIRGGSYSLRVDRSFAGEIIQKYIIAAVLGRCFSNSNNAVSCVRITPRRDFNILQIWNRDCQQYNDPKGLELVDVRIPDDEVKYMPHVEKKI
jgi:hypothetical protein